MKTLPLLEDDLRSRFDALRKEMRPLLQSFAANCELRKNADHETKYDRVYLFGDVAVKLVLKNGAWPPSAHAETIGTALARFPHLVCGKKVLDVGTGSGILAIIAARHGAAEVDVTELDASVLAAC